MTSICLVLPVPTHLVSAVSREDTRACLLRSNREFAIIYFPFRELNLKLQIHALFIKAILTCRHDAVVTFVHVLSNSSFVSCRSMSISCITTFVFYHLTQERFVYKVVIHFYGYTKALQ